MIMVTVGTTLPFDDLIKTIDYLVANKKITNKVICQIGNGEYEPTHCEYFRFKPDLDQLFEKASLVICHGGTGSVLGMLAMGKRFIAVANKIGADDHQALFLERLSQAANIIWTREVEDIETLLIEVNKIHDATDFALPSLYPDLKKFINNNE